MFSTVVRSLPRSVPASVAPLQMSGTQQAILATGSVGAWAAILFGAPYWAPKADKHTTRFFERVGERMERLPKWKKPLGIRIPVPRFGSVGI